MDEPKRYPVIESKDGTFMECSVGYDGVSPPHRVYKELVDACDPAIQRWRRKAEAFDAITEYIDQVGPDFRIRCLIGEGTAEYKAIEEAMDNDEERSGYCGRKEDDDGQ